MDVINEHAPIKYRTIKGSQVPYMNGELRRAINIRKMLKRKYDRCKTTVNWINYKNLRNIVTKLRKKSTNNYVQSKYSNTRGNFWDTVKPLVSQKSLSKNDKIILMKDDNVVTEPNEVVSCFNNYFFTMAMDNWHNILVRFVIFIRMKGIY